MTRYVIKRILLAIIALLFFWSALYFTSTLLDLFIFDMEGYTMGHFVPQAWQSLKDYWYGIIFDGDMGRYWDGKSKIEQVFYGLPYTLAIYILTLAFFIPVSFIIGFITAILHNTWVEKVINMILLTFGSLPIYITIYFIYWYLGYEWNILPETFPLEHPPPLESGIYYIIPVLSLSLYPIARVSRALRDELVETFDEDYFYLARAKGLSKTRTMIKHSFKNCVVSVLPEIMNVFIMVINLSFIVEIVYFVPGMARLAYNTLIHKDDITIYARFDVHITTIIAVIYLSIALIFGFVIDVLQVIIDPRLKYSKEYV